jgi:hypothetical protein
MKLNPSSLILILSCLTVVRADSETSWATAFCYSLQFEAGSDREHIYSLALSSNEGITNGELALDYLQSGYTHSSFLQFVDELLGTRASGQLGLDVPRGKDRDGDGFEDFFQVRNGVTNWTSSGAFELQGYGTGPVTATWNRPAGSSAGTCTLSLVLLPFELVEISHPFKILEYSGPLTYTRTPTNATGSVQLAQSCNQGKTMSGPIVFINSTDVPKNQLTLNAGAWKDEANRALSYSAAVYTRDAQWPTNYYGYFNFRDPDHPSEFCPYGIWLLSIDDLNDFDHNGIPNLSDVLSSRPPPSAPKLRISVQDQELRLTVFNGAGYVHELQTTTELAPANWRASFSVDVTNDPQSITLPKATGAATYWRLRVK